PPAKPLTRPRAERAGRTALPAPGARANAGRDDPSDLVLQTCCHAQQGDRRADAAGRAYRAGAVPARVQLGAMGEPARAPFRLLRAAHFGQLAVLDAPLR